MNNFSVADPNTDKRIVDALNKSFDSIQTLIDNYDPSTTEQDFAILNWRGEVKKDKAIHLAIPANEDTPIFCFYGSALKYIGTLVGNTLTFTETLEIDNDGKKEPYQALIYMPYRIAVTINPTSLTKDSFYNGKNTVQNEEQK